MLGCAATLFPYRRRVSTEPHLMRQRSDAYLKYSWVTQAKLSTQSHCGLPLVDGTGAVVHRQVATSRLPKNINPSISPVIQALQRRCTNTTVWGHSWATTSPSQIKPQHAASTAKGTSAGRCTRCYCIRKDWGYAVTFCDLCMPALCAYHLCKNEAIGPAAYAAISSPAAVPSTHNSPRTHRQAI